MDQQAFDRAVRSYWTVRESQAAKQLESGVVDAGRRGAVTGGAHLDALAELVGELFVDVGFPRTSVRRKTGIELPGYYRPTKKWDLVVIDHGRLIAAIEFKSQVGPSFGNNFNNRIEEAAESTSPVRIAATTFPVDPIFTDTSYQDRYRILCQRLIRERLYDAACFVTASSDPGQPIHQPDPETTFGNFVAAIAGRAAYIKALPVDM